MNQKMIFLIITIPLLCGACIPSNMSQVCTTPVRAIPDNPLYSLNWSKTDIFVYQDPFSPSIVGSSTRVFIITRNKNLDSSKVVSFDNVSGNELWGVNITLPVNIAANTSSLFVGSYDAIMEYEPASGLLKNKVILTNVGSIYNIFATEQQLFAMTNSGKWLRYNIDDRLSSLSEPLLPYTPFIIEQGVIYLVENHAFKAVDEKSQQVLWEYQLDKAINIHPLFTKDMIIVSELAGGIFSLSKKTGELLWQIDANAISNVSADDSRIFFLTREGDLRIMDLFSSQEILILNLSPGPFAVNTPNSDVAIGAYNVWVDSQNSIVVLTLGDSCQLMALKIINN